MKIHTLVFLCCFSVHLRAQIPDTLKSAYNGPFELKSSNGQLLDKGNFLNGVRHGKWEMHSPKTVYCEYKNGALDGEYREMDNDQVRHRWNYRNGKRYGQQEDFINGKPERTYSMKDDKYEGLMKNYSGDVLRTEANYKAGKRNGKTIEYHSNGLKEYEWEFKDGVADGLYTEYDSKGVVEVKGQMKQGKRDGKWTFISGSEKKEVTYADGMVVSQKEK